MLKSHLFDYSNVYVLFKGSATITGLPATATDAKKGLDKQNKKSNI